MVAAMTILLTASNAHHANLVVPLRLELEHLGHAVVIVYGGRRNPWWKPVGGHHISRYVRWPAWSRRALLEQACRRALRVHHVALTIVTSARYHLEQTMLRLATPCVIYHSTYFMEVRYGLGPRLEYYDVGDEIWTQGEHLREQLVAHGVRPERVHVVGRPWPFGYGVDASVVEGLEAVVKAWQTG